jgi:hypothetical protein
MFLKAWRKRWQRVLGLHGLSIVQRDPHYRIGGSDNHTACHLPPIARGERYAGQRHGLKHIPGSATDGSDPAVECRGSTNSTTVSSARWDVREDSDYDSNWSEQLMF